MFTRITYRFKFPEIKSYRQTHKYENLKTTSPKNIIKIKNNQILLFYFTF